jgi:hypothetical protein
MHPVETSIRLQRTTAQHTSSKSGRGYANQKFAESHAIDGDQRNVVGLKLNNSPTLEFPTRLLLIELLLRSAGHASDHVRRLWKRKERPEQNLFSSSAPLQQANTTPELVVDDENLSSGSREARPVIISPTRPPAKVRGPPSP